MISQHPFPKLCASAHACAPKHTHTHTVLPQTTSHIHTTTQHTTHTHTHTAPSVPPHIYTYTDHHTLHHTHTLTCPNMHNSHCADPSSWTLGSCDTGNPHWSGVSLSGLGCFFEDDPGIHLGVSNVSRQTFLHPGYLLQTISTYGTKHISFFYKSTCLSQQLIWAIYSQIINIK